MSTKFLIVDDIEGNRRLMRRLIEKHFPDAAIEEAESGLAALVHIRKHPPDIVILDVLMPDVDGYEVCHRLKADPANQSVMVLMVSAHLNDAKSRISGLRSGADSYLCKPFETNELVAQLTALERIRKTEQALRTEQQRLQQELTVRKKIEAQLETARRAAEAAARAKSEFLAHMSHEIRTPMNAVIGMTEILLGTQLSDEQREYVETIHTAGETLLMVINDILDFSKIESGKLTLEQRPFRLNDFLEDAISMVRTQAQGKGLHVVSSIAPDTPLTLVGDTIRLQQILSNLLSNAVKFTDQGEIKVQVSACRLDRRECELFLAVQDTGIGIPAAKMDCLFQSFSQIEDSTTRRFGGTGLGLAISQRLAKLMGGDINVRSNEGRGSCFQVRVRLKYERPAGAPTSAPNKQSPLAGRRILLVDDDAVARHMLARLANSWGIVVDEAASTEQALQKLKTPPLPDAILVNSIVGEEDGIDFACRIQADETLRTPSRILLNPAEKKRPQVPTTTADSGPDRLFGARLQKPVNASTLFDALISLVQPRKPETQQAPADGPTDLDTLDILVAEDNPVNRKVVEYMLRRLGCRYTFAEDGLAAVSEAERNPYDIILMDVQMPEMDGVEAMQTLRKKLAGKKMPRFVALTAHAMQGDREKYLQAGMDDYISKPIREKDLLRVLQECADRSQDKELPS